MHQTFKIQFDLWHCWDSSFFLNDSTCVKSFNRALLNRLFKDVSNYEIVKVLSPHFIVAKHAGGADLECGLQTNTRHDGHNSVHSQLRLGEKEGPQGFPLIPCHVCGQLLFSKVNQWFCSVSTHNFLYCYHLWMILWLRDCNVEKLKKKKKKHSGLVNLTTPLICQRVEMKHFFFPGLCCRKEVSHLTFFSSLLKDACFQNHCSRSWMTVEDVGKASVISCNCSVWCHFMTVNVSRTICIEPIKNLGKL